MKIRTFLFIFLLFLSLALYASTDGHNGHPFDWQGFWGWVINSTLLFGGLIVLLRKPLVKMLSKKSIDLKDDIIRREREVAEVSSQFDIIQKRLSRIEQEVEKIAHAARTDGEQEKEKIEAAGQEEAQRIIAITEEEINTRVDSAVAKLKARIADLAIEKFKKDFQTKLNDETHNRIIEKNIEISGDLIERE